ncbi:hypothetical protein F4824DRAFT_459438 [Ustulina deusta]|nr:hypothetical protein F4824DRAFT_459438 [Ustulina deusta]
MICPVPLPRVFICFVSSLWLGCNLEQSALPRIHVYVVRPTSRFNPTSHISLYSRSSCEALAYIKHSLSALG